MNAEEAKTAIQQASTLISSSLSSSSTIQSFPVKWQSIRIMLEHLHSCLTSVSNNADSARNSSFIELVQVISVTAKDTESLALRCSDESYNGGKLLMKSDLDVIATKIQLHVKHIDEIFPSGVPLNAKAIILSKPGAGATREIMEFSVKDIFSRLKIGDKEIRAGALSALNEVLKEDGKYARIVAAEMANRASTLVNLLKLRDLTIQEEILEAVVVVSSVDSNRTMLVMAGVVPPLIPVLRCGSELGKERAAQVLKQMTENCNNAWLLSSNGGVTELLKICNEETSSCKLISLACGVLRNISCVVEIKMFMVEEGAISVFLKLLKSKEELLQTLAMEFLYKLSLDSEDEIIIHGEVVRQKEEVVESLLTVLNPNSIYSSKVREISLRAIEGFCLSSTNAVNYLLDSGFLDQVLFHLKHGEILDQESALKTVSVFCRVSEEAKNTMGEMGFMTELVRMIENRSSEVSETAAETLCSLVLVQKNRKRFIQAEQNVDTVLQLLNPEEEKSVLRGLLLTALISLTDCNSGRRRVASSAYVRNLEKLAEINMTDAKKILKRITGNRFRSILNGIWGF
ncbi:uncharacterized protein LOC110022681 [Phalaenopsis equestris]|uniref:uncharacterized protein LOC110022681 n=1 Tax=Phalaenopsis equestris TaxID=78828 RepID=UPI0009E3A0F4|nr:uncharacterized protein LOC110022681 [Phalaenopsis equestris]